MNAVMVSMITDTKDMANAIMVNIVQKDKVNDAVEDAVDEVKVVN